MAFVCTARLQGVRVAPANKGLIAKSRTVKVASLNDAYASWAFDSDDESGIGPIRGAFLAKSMDEDRNSKVFNDWATSGVDYLVPGFGELLSKNKNYGSWDFEEEEKEISKPQSTNENMNRDF